jgi:hypothetical protein
MSKARTATANLLGIRPGDGLPLALLLLHAFFKGSSVVFFETPVDTLFLKTCGVHWLPYVFVGTAIVASIIGSAARNSKAASPPESSCLCC